ncbi:MAG TPA: hypothetical protein VE999_13925 [Gemmataceae bacterium]|nr:hypothetical protein [Gemmataceae bacterium]
MARPRKERPPTASEQLEALLGYPWPFPGRPPQHNLSTWTVTDDWPEPVPVTEAEVDVFEAWFGDLLDELFGRHRQLNSCGSQRKREARLQDHETMAAPVISRHVAIAFAR